MHFFSVILLTGLGAFCASPDTVVAQAVQVGVAGGFAIPTGAYGRTRIPGPVVRGSLSVGGPQRRVRLRGDIEGALLLDQADGESIGSSQEGTIRAVSIFVAAVAGPTGGRLAPYVIAGAGLQRLTVKGTRNPYGTTAGVRAGAGLRFRFGRSAIHAEVTSHLALTDFATGRDFDVGSYVPVVIGISF
ncbi:MAG: hypothetical protein WKF55_11475 [Gemmatimonadaceae bacterium]